MFTQSSRIVTTIFLVLAGVTSSSQAKAEWVAGGTQFANNYFTSVAVVMTVPPAPTGRSEAVSNFWPGIQDAKGSWVLQSVLSYGFEGEGWLMDNMVVGPSNNNPNNTSCPTGNATYCDQPRTVNSGDQILAAISLDACQMAT
jgi:hypothetical protein